MSFPQVIVEVGFTVGASTGTSLHLDDAARGLLDTGTLAADETWTNITSDGPMTVTTFRGASRADGTVLRYEAGRCSVSLIDNSRNYDPSNLSGPYVSGGVTQVTPMRAVRIRALHAGTYYDLWRGYADSWDYSYPADNLTTCTLQCTDGTKVLAANDRLAGGSVGSGEDSGARISRILDSAGWNTSDRIIATGDTTLQATTLASNSLTEIQLVQDTELGEFYMDGAGRAVFRNRRGIVEDSRSNTSQATFGDAGYPTELPYQSVTTSYDDTKLINVANISRSGGTQQTNTLDAGESIATYLTHTYERNDLLMETDGVALDMANTLVYMNKDPELRFETLTLTRHANSAIEDALFAQMLGREIGDRITVRRSPAGGGSAIERDCFVRGITHNIGPLTWETTFQLQSATKYAFLTLDNATLGTLDSNALSF